MTVALAARCRATRASAVSEGARDSDTVIGGGGCDSQQKLPVVRQISP